MKRAVWLSYDLSVKGDYEGLYAWLDNLKAIECGDSIAFFRWEDDGVNEISEQIKKSLLSGFEYSKKKDRIYLIYRSTETGNMKGRFICGNRKANPWEGLGSREVEDDYEEQ